MYHNIKQLAKTKNGELSYCKNCKVFHLSFNNLFFELSIEEFKSIKSYIYGLEIDYWEHKYSCVKFSRKIPLPSAQNNLVFMFNREEVLELRLLFGFNKTKRNNDEYISLDDIDYTFILN